MKRMCETLKELNHFFGYSNHPSEDNNTAFFNYDHQHPTYKSLLPKFKEFLKVNERNLALLRQKGEDRLKGQVVDQNPTFVFQPSLRGQMGTLFDINSRISV